jgi:ATP-dependent Lon protease
MKKAVLGSLLLLFGLSLSAQDDFRELFRGIELSSQEQVSIRQVILETQEVISRAQVEMNYFKAQVERLLFEQDVQLSEVEAVMRQSLEWRLKSQMAQIRRRVELRRLLGDERWAQVIRRFQNLEGQ